MCVILNTMCNFTHSVYFTHSVHFYMRCVILHTEGVILHRVYNFTECVLFYSECVILHTEPNSTHSLNCAPNLRCFVEALKGFSVKI